MHNRYCLNLSTYWCKGQNLLQFWENNSQTRLYFKYIMTLTSTPLPLKKTTIQTEGISRETFVCSTGSWNFCYVVNKIKTLSVLLQLLELNKVYSLRGKHNDVMEHRFFLLTIYPTVKYARVLQIELCWNVKEAKTSFQKPCIKIVTYQSEAFYGHQYLKDYIQIYIYKVTYIKGFLY